MGGCNICPRKCGADREHMEKGVCGVTGSGIYVAKASLHMWEEPCISGERGSGTIFFSGCNLGCVYCQNYEISRGMKGREITVEGLVDICVDLQKKGAHNINLVTPTHYALSVKTALLLARDKGLDIPVVYNSSGYEAVETLQCIGDVTDIYLTDFKYMYEETAKRYSRAADYPSVVKAALEKMAAMAGEAVFDKDGMMKRGVIVRHLLLPGHVREGKEIVKYLYDTYGNQIYISLMNQYTPVAGLLCYQKNREGMANSEYLQNMEYAQNMKYQQSIKYSELNRKVTAREYGRLVDYALELGVENAFIQEGDTAKESFIPSFDDLF